MPQIIPSGVFVVYIYPYLSQPPGLFFHLFSWLISSDFILFIGKHLYLIMEFSTQAVNLIIYCFYLYNVIPELHAKVIKEIITENKRNDHQRKKFLIGNKKLMRAEIVLHMA